MARLKEEISIVALALLAVLFVLAGSVWSEPKTRPPLDTPPGMFDIRAYGAVCDGVTDDTASIQAAIDAAEVIVLQDIIDAGVFVNPVATGPLGTILFPAGTCNVTTLTVTAFGMKFLGVSPLTSKIVGTALTGNVINWYHNHGRIERLNIGAETGAGERGDHTAVTPTTYDDADPTAGKHGILFRPNPDPNAIGSDLASPQNTFTQIRTHLDHVIVQDQPDDGILMEQPDLAMFDTIISKENGRFGIHLNGVTLGEASNNTLLNVRVGPDNVNTAFFLDKVSSTVLINPQVQSSTGNPQIKAKDGFNNQFINPTVVPSAYIAGAGILLVAENNSSVTGGIFSKMALPIKLTSGTNGATISYPRIIGDGGNPTLRIVDVDASSHDGLFKLGPLSSPRYINVNALTAIASGSTGNIIFDNALCDSVQSMSINPTEAGGTNDFVNVLDNTVGTTDAAEDDFFVPTDMTISSLYVDVDAAPGAGVDDWKITVNDDGATTVVTCNIDELETNCNSGPVGATGALSALIAAGSDMTVLVDSSGGAADPAAVAQMRISFCLSDVN